MQLCYARYNKVNPPKYYLLLTLGESDTNIHALLSEAVPDEEAQRITQNKPVLENMDMDQKNRWLSENTPTAYRSAYRTFNKESLEIVQNYQFKKKPAGSSPSSSEPPSTSAV